MSEVQKNSETPEVSQDTSSEVSKKRKPEVPLSDLKKQQLENMRKKKS
jgi:hypothetical protein